MLPIGLFRTLLWCYPAAFRHEYGAEMVCAFAEQVRDARQQGGWRAEASIWISTLFDVLFTAPREHSHVIQQDLRYAIRTLALRPGFAAVAVLSLALGIGANTAIFSLINSVLLSTLPVRDPQSLIMLTNPTSNGVTIGGKSGEREELTYSEFRQLRDLSSVFASLMACQIEPERVPARVEGSVAEEIVVQMVSPEYFSTLGVPALLGRTLSPDDDPAAPNVVISYDFWQRRFGRRADVLGSRIAIRQGVFSIIGVAPASFFGETVGQQPQIWTPLSMQPVVLPGRDWLHENPGDRDKVMWLHVLRAPEARRTHRDSASRRQCHISKRSSHFLRLRRESQESVAQTTTGCQRRVADSRAVCGTLDDAPGCFRARAADRLRESRQPAAGARYGEDT